MSAAYEHSPGFAAARARDTRVLVVFVAVSVIVHVLVAVVLPGLRAPQVPNPLQVTLEEREPPRVTPARPIPASPALGQERRTRKKAPAQKPLSLEEREKPPLETPRETPVLALPQSPATPEPTFAVPAREEKPQSGPIEGSGGREGARASPAGGDAPGPAKITPPSSDAAYLQNPQPRYPLSARRRGEQGTVVLKVLVTRDGLAGSVAVHASSGFASLDQAALDAVRNWRFVPARRGAQPIEAWHLVPIVFKLEGVS